MDDGFEDPVRLLHREPLVDDVARAALTSAVELLWDDLLDCVEADTVADAALIRLLPQQFHTRAVGDWRRWLATFTAVVGKLGQPTPLPPATMAEQLYVGAIVHYATTAVPDLLQEDSLDFDVPNDGIDVDVWIESYLSDVDHELLYDPAVDGIDDESTQHRYAFGRMDYEGMFAAFNERLEGSTGAPHPLASLRMTADEWRHEQQLRHSIATASVAVAQTATAGTGYVDLAGSHDDADMELVAHRVAALLDVQLRVVGPATIELVGPVDDATRDKLADWLRNQDPTS